jgi:hypothetical protein
VLLEADDELRPGDRSTLDVVSFPGGAAAVAGSRAWVLLDEAASSGLGRALAWTSQRSADEVHVLAEEGAGVLARRAGLFRDPPRVWQIAGRRVAPAAPEPFPSPPEPPANALEFVGLLREAGLDIVIEHGEVRGEILGLEVARVVVGDGPPRVVVGVGRHDRDAFALVHGDLPPAAALESVVDSVRRHRRPGGPGHPLGRLVPERWLRRAVVADPGRVGARHLDPVEPILARESVKDVAPALAVGESLDGAPLVVACSVGIDLDLVPAAADARAAHTPEATLVLVIPTRDDHSVTRRLAGALRRPARIIPFEGDFRV